MARRKSRKKNKILGYEKKYVYTTLIAGAFVMLLGGTTLMSAFGVDTVWGGDVQFYSIKYFDQLISNPSELPEYAFNVGSRTITADFDGKIVDTYDWDTAPLYFGDTFGITYEADGMVPTINYDVGRFKYFNNLSQEISVATGFPIFYENETADVHFYFGFSVGFSTAAYEVGTGEIARIFVPSSDTRYGWYTQAIVECAEAEMMSTIALRFEPIISGAVIYSGELNEVRVYRERAYYVTQPPGEEYETIEDMNANFDWNGVGYQISGYAESLGIPKITYNVIDSDTEKMATIELGAKLRPGVDPLVIGNKVSEPDSGLDGWISVGAIDTYNVGYVYDLVIDVSINGIPLTDPDAEWLMGRFGINFPAVPPLPWYLQEWVLIIALILGFILIPTFLRGRG